MRSRAVIVALTVVMSVLVATAPVAVASHGLGVASIHTTDTDFNAADTLDNVTVNGSGSDASVELNQSRFEDGFENEAADSGTPDDWEAGANGVPETVEVSTAEAAAGSQSLHLVDSGDGGAEGIRPAEQPYGSEITDNISVSINAQNTETMPLAVFEGSTRIFLIGMRNGNLEFFNGSWNTLSSSVTTNEWVNVTVFDIDPGSDTFAAEWESPSDSGSSSGLTMENAMSNGYDSTELAAFTSADVHYDEFAIGEPDEGTYVSANHSVDDAEQGFTNLTLTNVSAEVTWQEHDGSSWTDIASGTFTTTGNHTVDISSATNSNLRVNVTFTVTDDDASAALHDEGVQFNGTAPTVDNSSASPTGELTTATPTFTIDVNDSDFSLAQSDTLTAELFVDGNSEGTDTLTSNGTASVSATVSGGDQTYNWTVTDEYGHSTTSQDFQISAPANVTVRNETAVHGTVNEEVTFKIFEQETDGPAIKNGTTENGNISLSGLPIGSEYTIQLSAPNYHNRTVVINDVFAQTDAFLLHTDHSSVTVTFDISDPTGQFAGETTEIVVQRAINESLYNGTGGFSFMDIEGDEVGASGDLRVTLQQHERYRIQVSTDDETRILGGYSAEADASETLRPSVPDVNVTDEQGYAWNASTNATADTITFEYLDPDENTTDLELVIYETSNSSNELYNQTHAGPHGFLRVTQMLTDAQANKTWAVSYSATREGGTIGGEQAVGRKVIETLPELDDIWKNAVAVIITILTGALFSVRNAETGAVTTSFVGGGFWMSGWLPTEAGGAIMVALFVAVLWKTQAGRFG